MFARIILTISLLVATVSVASADDRKVWYQKGYDKQVPTTFKAAIVAEKEFLGANNPFWKGHKGGKKLCAALKAVHVSCDYNTRFDLSLFLTVNGKGLFPASGGTNPYATERDSNDVFPDDGYIGRPKQNEMLARSIIRNARLFHDGDITAEVVKNNWR